MGTVPSAADVFRAIADPTRRNLLDLLRSHEHSVNELVASFRISQSAISQHLRILRSIGLVRARRRGRHRLYRLNPGPLREVLDWANRFEGAVIASERQAESAIRRAAGSRIA